MDNRLEFKIASEEWELAKVHDLNYSTFVEEIPQHSPNTNKSLVDKFHDENTYAICIQDQEVLGMITIRDKRPFSLDTKLANLDSYLPSATAPCEIRLLAIKPDRRNGRIIQGLFTTLAEYADKRGYDLALISGILSQIKLYQHIGFVAFGPVVGTADAPYQPMYLSLAAYKKLKNNTRIFTKQQNVNRSVTNFLPGPVAIADKVRQAYSHPPVSHRSAQFMRDFNDTRQQLCELVHAQQVVILMGSGTLANDAIAAQLSLLSGKGLILVNGEFGQRLADQASRANLSFLTVEALPGERFDSQQIKHTVDNDPAIRWLWAVHCETSTGMLNDIEAFANICSKANIHLCLDCISSIGTVPINLSKVYLASCVSGKGLGSLPGLAMVFYNHRIALAGHKLPRYLDLGFYAEKNGIPFTLSSNSLYALSAALEHQDWGQRYKHITAWSTQIRRDLQKSGLPILVSEAYASSAVITVPLPASMSSLEVGTMLEDNDILISYRSEFLLKKNWVQLCMMSEIEQDPQVMLALLKEYWARHNRTSKSAQPQLAQVE